MDMPIILKYRRWNNPSDHVVTEIDTFIGKMIQEKNNQLHADDMNALINEQIQKHLEVVEKIKCLEKKAV